MKKALALSFLLLAGIALLAHSAIPHHYHEGIPVAVTDVCNSACSAGGEAATCTCHHHHHDSGSATGEDCLLEKMSVRTAGNDRLPDASDGSVFLLLCMPRLLSGSVDLPEDLASASFAYKPCVQTCHTTFIARSLGLRAPPAC